MERKQFIIVVIITFFSTVLILEKLLDSGMGWYVIFALLLTAAYYFLSNILLLKNNKKFLIFLIPLLLTIINIFLIALNTSNIFYAVFSSFGIALIVYFITVLIYFGYRFKTKKGIIIYTVIVAILLAVFFVSGMVFAFIQVNTNRCAFEKLDPSYRSIIDKAKAKRSTLVCREIEDDMAKAKCNYEVCNMHDDSRMRRTCLINSDINNIKSGIHLSFTMYKNGILNLNLMYEHKSAVTFRYLGQSYQVILYDKYGDEMYKTGFESVFLVLSDPPLPTSAIPIDTSLPYYKGLSTCVKVKKGIFTRYQINLEKDIPKQFNSS